MTTLCEKLLEQSLERIRQHLPEDCEMDDIGWNEEAEIFQICVFDVSALENSMRGAIDRFVFYRIKGETDEEMTERWNRKLQAFCERLKGADR